LPECREENVPDILGHSNDMTRPRLPNPLTPERVLAGTLAADPAGGSDRDDLLVRVREQLAPGPEGYADLERVAARLFMSGRTLKRKLQERGTTFRALQGDARFRQAQQLLADPELEIAQVAAALGYRDPACFTRAFRRWSGRTPSQARADRKAVH
jgi:AraC-like DNA-binding protein